MRVPVLQEAVSLAQAGRWHARNDVREAAGRICPLRMADGKGPMDARDAQAAWYRLDSA